MQQPQVDKAELLLACAYTRDTHGDLSNCTKFQKRTIDKIVHNIALSADLLTKQPLGQHGCFIGIYMCLRSFGS